MCSCVRTISKYSHINSAFFILLTYYHKNVFLACLLLLLLLVSTVDKVYDIVCEICQCCCNVLRTYVKKQTSLLCVVAAPFPPPAPLRHVPPGGMSTYACVQLCVALVDWAVDYENTRQLKTIQWNQCWGPCEIWRHSKKGTGIEVSYT